MRHSGLSAISGLAAALIASSAWGEVSQPGDLSPVSMFLNADIVVKAVMVGLALASVATWTVWLAKGVELGVARRRARRANMLIDAAPEFDLAAGAIRRSHTRQGAVGEMLRAAQRELERSRNMAPEGVKERVAMIFERVEARSAQRAARGTGVLATIGATAPFVGLLGTVWGIMNSFVGISRSHTTNLAVVAPGIAEALLATAIGLVAAIPAVVIYNVFARAVAAYRADLADASSALMRHLSRDLESDAATAAAPALRRMAE